jgi:hypothetical protein
MNTDLTFALQRGGLSPFVVILLCCGVLLAVYWYYRRTVPPLTRRRKMILGALRGMAALLLVLLLLDPLLSLSREISLRPRIAVVVDESASLSLTDGSGNRAAQVQAIFEGDAWQNLQSTYDVSTWRFATDLDTLQLDAAMTFTAEGSDIGRALAELREQYQPESPDMVMLLTDGAYTTGENPLPGARVLGTPVYTIGVGDSSRPRDAVIRDVQAAQLAYPGEEIPITVTVAGNGFAGKSATVTLGQGSGVLQSATVTLADDGQEIQAAFTLTPAVAGPQVYRIELSAQDDELTTANNTREIAVRVMERKRRVLICAGRPDADFAFLKRQLSKDRDVAVTTYVERFGGQFYEGAGLAEALAQTDALILCDFPTTRTTPATMQVLRSRLQSSILPLWLLTGRTADQRLRDFLQPVLPLQVRSVFNDERLVHAALTNPGHTAVRLREMAEENAAAWQSLPPVFSTGRWLMPVEPVNPWIGVEPVRSRLTVKPGELPLLTGVRHKGRKIAIWNGYGYWRWHLMVQEDSQLADAYQVVLSRTLDWLVDTEEEKLVRVTADQNLYNSGESIRIATQVYTEDYTPLDGAQVNLTLQGEGTPIERTLEPQGAGAYTARLEVLEPGDYTVIATAEYANRTLGADTTTVTVGAFSLEQVDPRMRADLLRRIAEDTGGRFVPVADAAEMLASIDLPPNIRHVTQDRRFDGWQTLCCLAGLLIIEWVLRKRWGLL